MTEADLIVAWGEISAHLWTIVQFWTSITFGVIAISHFASERLNLFRVALIVILYLLFSLMCFGFFRADVQLLLSLYEEASVLLEERDEASIFLSQFVEYFPTKSFAPFGLVGFPLIFLGSIGYLLHRFLREQ